jgi:hypothetical protein
MATANKVTANARDGGGEEERPKAMGSASTTPPASCPVATPLVATEPLYVPHRKRLVSAYDVDAEGGRELRINYGVKEVSFDDPRFFVFGEQLVSEPSFTGEQAMTWGPGYSWDELRPLLESLVDEGVLARGKRVEDVRGAGPVSSRLPPSECPEPRSWSLAECEAITRDLGGRAVEIGYLEAVVPAVRIPHPALDGDQRQVGEANVFPSRLRLDRETEWRVCQYPGSRFRDDTPMNVTALKAMIKHWKPMMSVITAVRAELQARLSLGRDQWTIGDLNLVSSLVLSVPAFRLMQRGGGSPQPPLHPVLSSMFRVTDGVRMTTYVMFFDIENVRPADEPLTASQLYNHAERHGVFIGSTTGVCAGPKHMIDELLALVVDGVPVEGVADVVHAPEVEALLDQLPTVVDYGLHAMQTWGVSLAVWIAMSRTYEAVLAILEDASRDDACAKLRTRLRSDWNELGAMQISLDYDRDVHMKAYVDQYERAWRALRVPLGAARHAEETAPVPETPAHRAIADQLRATLGTRLADSELAGAAVDQIVELLIGYLRAEQAVLASTTKIQNEINRLLDRPSPTRPLSVRDFRVHYSMAAGVGSFPYLLDTLDEELGLWIESSASGIDFLDRRVS